MKRPHASTLTPEPTVLSTLSSTPSSLGRLLTNIYNRVVSKDVPSTPTLCGEIDEEVGIERDWKKRRIDYGQASTLTPAFIQTVPPDVLSVILQFLNVPSSWNACSLVCKQWRQVALSKPVAETLRLWDRATGAGAVQLEAEASNVLRLEYFASKKNPDAMYLLGTMLCYTGSVSKGVEWFDKGAELGDVRSVYGKGIVVRDGDMVEGERCLRLASSLGYYPAMLEMSSNSRVTPPPYEELKQCMIPKCLLRYLRRWFVEDDLARGKKTSHCWNPECGRWAEKTLTHEHLPSNGFFLPPTGQDSPNSYGPNFKLSRMKMCSSCRRAKYCSKFCQVYDWRVGKHKNECPFLG